jgi:hypothetical protein
MRNQEERFTEKRERCTERKKARGYVLNILIKVRKYRESQV